MRHVITLLAAAVALAVPAAAQSCPAGQTTTISGTIYAPNGKDPLPNVLVYIPSTTVAAFTPGVSCPVPGQLPSGAPVLAGTLTATDGTFTLTDVPVAANIPLVAQAGKWRRQTVVSGTVACQNTAVDPKLTRMPKDQTEGDIPKIAIATGSADQVECVLRKVGISDSEFTNPSGNGVDFSLSIAPTSGSVIAGLAVIPTLTLTPIAGFNAPVTLTCPATASGTTCTTGAITLTLSSKIDEVLKISTISQYNVVGYGGFGGGSFTLFWIVSVASGLLLWRNRHSASLLLRAGLFALLLAAGGLSLSGCSGHLPDSNNPYTPTGTYTYTVTATDGTLTRTATYSLTVTVR